MNPAQAQEAAAEAFDAKRREYPPITDALLDALDREFPDRCPKPSVPVDEVRAMSGAVQVVRWLRHVKDWQEGTVTALDEDIVSETFQSAMIGDLDSV